eukprot:g27303.t1
MGAEAKTAEGEFDVMLCPNFVKEGLRALHFFLEQRSERSTSTTILLCLAELVLTLNKFSFNSSFSSDKRGSYGNPHGPQLCLSLHG